MATTELDNRTTTRPHHYRLAVNNYDRTSSMLVALLIMVGVTVAGLLIIFYARRLISAQVAIPVQSVDVASRPADAALGLKRDLEPPGIEEAPELDEPQLQDTLTAVANAVSSRTALLSDEAIDSDAQMAHGRGLGDSRMAGLGGTGDTFSEPRRQLRFEPESVEDYARWLDFFGIELGVLGRDNRIYYAYNFTRAKPAVRVGSPEEENRLYMNSSGGPLAMLDRRFVRTAGIGNRGSIILQFYPPETEAILLSLEQQQAEGRSLDDIRLTVFRVNRGGDGYQFSVEEQRYR